MDWGGLAQTIQRLEWDLHYLWIDFNDKIISWSVSWLMIEVVLCSSTIVQCDNAFLLFNVCSLCLPESSMDLHATGQSCLCFGFLSLVYGLHGRMVLILHNFVNKISVCACYYDDFFTPHLCLRQKLYITTFKIPVRNINGRLCLSMHKCQISSGLDRPSEYTVYCNYCKLALLWVKYCLMNFGISPKVVCTYLWLFSCMIMVHRSLCKTALFSPLHGWFSASTLFCDTRPFEFKGKLSSEALEVSLEHIFSYPFNNLKWYTF